MTPYLTNCDSIFLSASGHACEVREDRQLQAQTCGNNRQRSECEYTLTSPVILLVLFVPESGVHTPYVVHTPYIQLCSIRCRG